jgi:ribosomal subunit interface protein
MQLSVSGKHLDIGDSLRGHVTSALSASAGRYFGRAIEGKVVFQRARHAYRADISLHVARGLLVQSHGEAADPYLAFDAAAERLDKQMRRTKRRLVGRRRENGAGDAAAQDAVPVTPAARPARKAAKGRKATPRGAAPAGEDRERGRPAVVADMSVPVETLSVGEAVERLDGGDAQVLMFKNRTHGGYNVLYRRGDGTIGWIDPPRAAKSGPTSR